jgi:uncharacterized protein
MVIQRTLALLLALFAGSSMAASFDCTKASSFAEKEICRDGYLSTVDGNLAYNYKKALSTTLDPDALRQSQRDWLTIRDQCTTQKCLDQTMGARSTLLENYTATEKSKAEAAVQKQLDAKRQAEEAERNRQTKADEQAYQQRKLLAEQQQTTFVRPKAPISASIEPTYQTPAYSSSQQQNNSNTSSKVSPPSNEIENMAWKGLILMAVLLSCLAVRRHHQRKATIYNDYTDASVTNLLPIIGFVTGLLCGWLGLPHQVYQVCVVTGVVLAACFAIYGSIKVNRGGFNIFLTVIAKLTFISVFYIIMALLVVSLLGIARRKGESLTQAEARQRRQARESKIAIAATSAGYTFFTAWLCRRAEFTSLTECLEFEPSSHTA